MPRTFAYVRVSTLGQNAARPRRSECRTRIDAGARIPVVAVAVAVAP